MEKTKYDGNQVIAWDKCDWMPKELQVPAEIGKISDAIRAGHKLIREDRMVYLHNDCGCAMGMAGAAIGMATKYTSYGKLWAALSKRFHIPKAVMDAAELKHCEGLSALGVADWLESQGY